MNDVLYGNTQLHISETPNYKLCCVNSSSETVSDNDITSNRLSENICEVISTTPLCRDRENSYINLPNNPLLSDVHNGIAVEFLSKPLQQIVVENEEQSTKKCKWVNEKKDTFSNAIDLLSVLELEHTMSDIISSECTNVDQVIVDSLVENCNKILLDAASESEMFFTYKHRNKVVKKVKKPWFNRDCFIKRKEYFIVRNTSWRVKSAENRTNLIRCSKAYKKEINKQYNA